jgi:hypothetical protein
MNDILSLCYKDCNKYVGIGSQIKPDLLSEPELLSPHPRARSQFIQRHLDQLYEAYQWAFVKARAIDDPKSFHASLSEDKKAEMRSERYLKLAAAEQKYVSERAKEEQRRYKEQLKKAKAASKTSSKHPQQLRLFEDAFPFDFAYIAEKFPNRPRVSNDLERGSTIRPLKECSGWKYIQYNPIIYDHLLIIDYDAPEGKDIKEAIKGLPNPTWISRTPRTNKGHIAWALLVPVLTSTAAKLKPLQYLARIEEGFRKHINGDKGFAGTLTKNPTAPDYWDIEWIEPKPYSLDELAASVQIERYTSKKKAEQFEPVGLGRKVLTFEKARHWAYSAVSEYWEKGESAWFSAVTAKVQEINMGFPVPLEESHIKSIAKSISNWVWKRFTPLTKHQLVMATHTPEVQSIKGKIGGKKSGESRRAATAEKRAQAKELRAQGMTYKSIASELNISVRAAHEYCNKTV